MSNRSFELVRPALYVVATPIGNLRDITLRALDVLRKIDVVAAEDTRVTRQLLQHYDISCPVISLYAHNEHAGVEKIISYLDRNYAVAQVCDAGTPSVSDPGQRLIAYVHTKQYPVIPVPGACTLAAAYSVSGFNCTQILFYGFLPSKAKQRKDVLYTLRELPYLCAFYEAPHRIVSVLEDMVDVFGPLREALFARELTKLFETVKRMPLVELSAWVGSDSNQQRGEFTLIIDAAPAQKNTGSEKKLDSVLIPLLETLPIKQALTLAKSMTGVSRNVLYKRMIMLKEAGHH